MRKIFAILFVLSLLAGCAPPQADPPNLDQAVIETLVAASLTAEPHSPDQSDQSSDAEAPAQDETPQPPPDRNSRCTSWPCPSACRNWVY